MNNNLGIRKLLTVAACIAVVGNPSVSYSSTIEITEDTSAVAPHILVNTGSSVMPQMKFPWQAGNNESVDVKVLGEGNLSVSGYSSDVVNGKLNALGGEVNLLNGVLTIDSGSSILGAVLNTNADSDLNIIGGNVILLPNSDINGNINISDGILAIGTGKSSSSAFTQSGGYTHISSASFYFNNNNDDVSGGNFSIGLGSEESPSSSSYVNVAAGNIRQEANVSINDSGSMYVTGGNVTLDSNDTWNGGVNVTGGSLALVGIQKNGRYSQSGGNVTVTGSGVSLNSGDRITGGNLNIGNSSQSADLYVNGGSIGSGTNVNLDQSSSIQLNSGSVDMDGGDVWGGVIDMSGGTLNINNAQKSGGLSQSGGIMNVTGTKFDLNNSYDVIDGGVVNVGNGSAPAKLTVSQGLITTDSTVNIRNNSTLDVSGGNVTLDSGDAWDGEVHSSGGSLALVGVTKNGTFTQSGGSTTLNHKNFDLNNEDDYIYGGDFTIGNGVNPSKMSVSKGSISKDANIHVTNNSTLNIKGGNVEYGSGGEWDGNINISKGNLTFVNASKNSTGVFTQTGGKTTVIGEGLDLDNYEDAVTGGTLNIGNKAVSSTLSVSEGYIDTAAVVNINRKGTLNVSGGEVVLDEGDMWRGDVNVSAGNLELNSITKNSEGKFTQTGGKTTITGETFDLNNSDDNISGGTLNIGTGSQGLDLEVSAGTIGQGAKVNLYSDSNINISGGHVALDNTDKWDGNISVNGGSLALIGINNRNGGYSQRKGATTVIESGFDLNQSTDIISGGNLNIGDGTTVSDMSVSQGTIGANTNVNIADKGTLKVTGGNVSLNSNTIYNGNIEVASGTLHMESVKKNEGATFAQNAGTVTVNGLGFDLNNESDSVAGGVFNIGNGTTLTEVGVSKGTIKSEAVTNINTNSTLSISGGGVVLNDNDNWNGRVNISNGKLNLDNAHKNTDGVLNQSGGTTTVTGHTFDLNNTYDRITGGTINVGTEQEPSTLAVSRGTVEAGAGLNLSVNSNMNITGGSVTVNENDNWNGNINLSNGSLNIAGINKNPSGTLTQTGGKTTVTGSENTFNNENDSVTGGNLIIGTSTESGELNIEAGNIASTASVTINESGTLNIKGGTTTLDGANDKWSGTVNVSNGVLNLNNKLNKLASTAPKFNQTGGTTNIDDARLALNSPDSKITGGEINITSTGELIVNNSSENKSDLNIENGKFSLKQGSKYTLTGGKIDEESKVVIENNAALAINNETANVTLDGASDSFAGSTELLNGTLNIKNGLKKVTTSGGTFIQAGGTTNISGSSKLAIEDSTGVITGGEMNITDNSEFDIANGKSNSAILNVSGSRLGIKNKTEFESTGGTITEDSAVTITSGSKFKINSDNSDVSLDGNNDIVNGHIELEKGDLHLAKGISKVTDDNGTYVQTGGNLTMDSSSLTLSGESSGIAAGNVKLQNNSTLTVADNGASLSGGNISIDDTSVLNYLVSKGLVSFADGNQININTSGLVNLANNVKTNTVMNDLTVDNGAGSRGVADFAIDIYARQSSESSSDIITAKSIKVAQKNADGTLNISDYNLGGDVFGYDAPLEKHIKLNKVFNSDDIDNEIVFTATDKETFTPIGYYKLRPSGSNDGSYSFDLTRYNPQVFRGQVATAAQYLNQFVVNDTLFNRAQIRRYGQSYSDAFKNKTAILDGSADYERTLRDGQLWTEAFGNFETLKLNNGLNKVRNNSYGFIVGGDFGLRELKNGWSWMPTAYIAYNGAHQTFNGVGMYENGAQLGFMGSFMKDKFTETGLAYVGAYVNSMDVAGTSEDALNYFFGLASKTSYDWNVSSHFKIQPSLTLAYNMFGQQNWHSDFGQMSMMSGFMNGFNVAPGVNFVLQQESWNLYATVAYAWNFFGSLDGRAGYVDLPNVKMTQGYLQYGFGMTKMFSDRFNMYAQATIRNIGRTGIICQGGLQWRL